MAIGYRLSAIGRGRKPKAEGRKPTFGPYWRSMTGMNSARRRLGTAVLLLALVSAALAGTPARLARPLTVVYVSHADSNDVYVLQLDRLTGDATLIQKVSIPGVKVPGTSTPMAVSPDRRFLYVATRGEPKAVAGFAIDPTDGTLTRRSSGPLPDSMAFIVTDRAGRFLLGASFPGHVVSVSPISPPGTVRPASQVLANHPNAHSIRPDASNRRVVALTFGNDRVNQFTFDPALGVLTPDEASSFTLNVGTGPRHFVFHPHRPVIYVLGERDGAVHVLDVDAASGRMRERQIVSALPPGFQGTPSAADLHITPDGRWLYASERTSGTLAGFRVDPASDALSGVGHVPTEQTPRGFSIDPSGRYLLAVGQGSHHLSVYRIDGTSGRLDILKRYPMGKNPNWVEIVDLR